MSAHATRTAAASRGERRFRTGSRHGTARAADRPGRLRFDRRSTLEGAGDALQREAFDEVADLDVLEALALRRRQHAGEHAADVVEQVVDDRVVADLHALALGEVAGLLRGADVE